MAAATKKVKRETDRAVSEECRRWNWAAMARDKNVEKKPVDDVQFARETVPAGFGQETSIVVIKDSVAPPSEIDAVVLPANITLRVSGDVESQHSTGGESVRQDEEAETVEFEPDKGIQNHATVAGTVCVNAPDQMRNDVFVKVKEMVEKLKTESFSMPGNFVAERAAHARALMDSIHLQRVRRKFVEEKEGAWRVLAVEKTECKNSAGLVQLKKDFLTVTMNAAEEVNALAT